jgi:hypothetical protein
MIRASVLFLLLLPTWLAAQVRLSKLVIKSHEVYELKNSDILIVDTLVMMDSSVLLLNKLKRENFIHARRIIFYRGCLIDGKGVHGLIGRNGRKGTTSTAPCSNGNAGLKGTDGTNGGVGINLFLSFNDLVLNGVPTIDVSGGDAGDGGKGGSGGGGGTGTRLCAGGNGGAGGSGSNGGNGGNAGSVTFHANNISELRSILGDRLLVHNFGGHAGNGGEGGGGGYAGLSPTGKNSLDGKTGKKGVAGKDGIAGKPGAINFQGK